jgi:D-3-phosphoglycerate dehydrogenase / 2-oxoglutarate reductase
MPRVLIGAATLRNVDGPYLRVLRDAGFEVVYPAVARQMTEDEILAELKGIDAVLAGSEPYTPRVLDANPQLRVIARNGVGYDAVDLAACTARGVPVTIAPANQEAVAEHAFALILALAKQVIPQHLKMKAGGWPRQMTQPLRGKTLGLVGLGRIGKAVAVRGVAFGMRVIAFEPYPDEAFVRQHAIALVPLERVFADADYVSLHMPLSPDSRSCIGKKLFGLMKPTAYFVNTARGPVVCESDLYELLRDGKIAGAGLDVFEEEPPPAGNPLLQLDNVVLTAHTAGVDARSGEEMALVAATTIAGLFRGEWPEGLVVNPSVRDEYRWKRD